jgi:hypothetical protein
MAQFGHQAIDFALVCRMGIRRYFDEMASRKGIIVPYRPFKSMTLNQTLEYAASKRECAKALQRHGGDWRDIRNYTSDAEIAESAALRAAIVWC